MSETPQEPLRCPKCGSADVRYSYTQNKWDVILDLLFSMDAFRCRSCRARFHKYSPGDDEEPESVDPKEARREEDVSRS